MRPSAKASLTGALLLFAAALVPGTLALIPTSALAQCVVTDPAGDDVYVCTTDVGPLTDLMGNNMLTLPAAGAGTITGNGDLRRRH